LGHKRTDHENNQQLRRDPSQPQISFFLPIP
jgi:hypothetical protein